MNRKLSTEERQKFEYQISVLVFLMIAVAALYTFGKIISTKKDFFNELWAPAYLLVDGKSPYNTSSLQPDLPAVWLPMAVGVFFPLGLLNEPTALKLWAVINVIELGLIVWFIAREIQPAYALPLSGVLAYFFPSTINHFVLGQFSITVTLCFILASYFANRGIDWGAAIFVALGLSKPQLGILAIFGLSVFYFKKSKLKGLAIFYVQVFIVILTMCIPLFVAYPAWIPDWIKSFESNSYPWLHPSTFSILRINLGSLGYAIWGMLALLVFAVCFQLWTKTRSDIAMMWTLGLTTIITPYIWSWDFVLLLPIWTYIFSRASWKKRVFLLAVYLISWAGMAMIQLSENNNNVRFWWVPLFFMGGIALVDYFPASSSAQEQSVLR